ncbi:hypothetical protein [Burkholderia stagnalis]|uniref:hypothetical protein n=1 Tax=Burkholderia stagnalis TaxID=1503054 RepID=UPI000757419E|nr:hypothetical protein [Burkholderia stagnalis]KVL93089.1 hypothetical protein WT03_18970 [Burkholderia stagnalis]KVL94786.1 hypothetical protein WT02_18140 [Burkholderia stagnalis]KVM13119.1 hypothetical protein WT04_11460 [Burkholderia stagnalis]
MRLVDHKDPEVVNRELSAQEAAAVRRFCGKGQRAQAGDSELVGAILAEMHDGRRVQQWLECDCQVDGTTQPRLTARVREEGPRHFVRMNRQGEHLCALAAFRSSPEPDDELDDDAPPGKHQPLKPVDDALDFLDDLHEGASRPRGGGGGASRPRAPGRRLPRLGRIMHTLLDDVGFAVLSDASENTRSSWDRLNDYALDEAMSEMLSLGQILYTKPWLSIADKMDAIDALPWPEGKARSALLLFVADEIRDGAAIKVTSLGECVVRPEKGIRIGGRDQNMVQPPYWVLAVVDRDRNGQARFREAFAQHAYSRRQPVPLDSRFERVTLNCLIQVIDWVRRRGVDVTLTKPLFDRQVDSHDGEPLWCRPDFELSFSSAARAHRIVIETMGADDADYLERKSRMHDIMWRRGILLEHHVLDDGDQAERDKAFVRRTGARILDLAGIKRPES